MAYKRTTYRSFGMRRKVKLSEVLPIWSVAQTETTNMVVLAALAGWGIVDFRSYLRILRIPIALCVFIGSIAGAANAGLSGLITGGLIGVMAPAGLVWLGMLLVYIALYLLAYFAAWAVIISVLCWLLSG